MAERRGSSVGLDDTHIISWIVVDPHNPDVVYAAALGHLFGPNPDRGVFKTTDGGRTWKKILYVDDATGAISMAMDPSNPHVRVRGDVADVPEPLDVLQRRAGQRHLQDHRRRRDLDQHLPPPGAAHRHLREGRPRGSAEQSQRGVRADSGGLQGTGGRPVPVRRCRPELDARQQQHGYHAARLLLQTRVRRSQGRQHDLPAQRRVVRIARRRARS